MPPYKGPGEPKDLREKPLDYAGFKALLIESVNKHPVPEIRLPAAIETGAFGEAARALLKETVADPQQRERAHVIIATLDNGLKMTNKPQIGTQDEVGGEHTVERVRLSGLPGYYSKREQTAMRIHTHCDDTPPSIFDCGNLIMDPDSGVTAEMVATTGGYYLVMRTLEGVDLEKSEAETAKWTDELKKELIERLKIINQGAASKEESNRRQVAAMNALFRQISAKYHLAVYTSPEGIIYMRNNSPMAN